jgi:hypothetical protein
MKGRLASLSNKSVALFLEENAQKMLNFTPDFDGSSKRRINQSFS